MSFFSPKFVYLFKVTTNTFGTFKIVNRFFALFSHLHFSSNKDATDRLKRFGEEHFRIKEVGAPQLDDIYLKGYIPKNNNFLFEKYGIRIISKKYLLVVYHPVVESINSLKKEFNVFMKFLKKMDLPKRRTLLVL